MGGADIMGGGGSGKRISYENGSFQAAVTRQQQVPGVGIPVQQPRLWQRNEPPQPMRRHQVSSRFPGWGSPCSSPVVCTMLH
eukprot:1196061-Prorocentrum_minimum.AAC.1